MRHQPRARDRHRRGQSLVEFALVLPMFLLVIIAFVEFAFAFSTLNSLNFAARDLAQFAAEAGTQAGADCSTLNLLEKEFGASSQPAGITSVVIYWSDGDGNIVNSAMNQYNRTGSWTCTDLGGVSRTLPYTAVTSAYLEQQRCAYLRGCPSLTPPHPALDTIGVRLTYAYQWITPLASLLNLAGTPNFTSTQQVRIEPVL